MVVESKLRRLLRNNAYTRFKDDLVSNRHSFGKRDWKTYDQYLTILDAFAASIDGIPEFDTDVLSMRQRILETVSEQRMQLELAAEQKRDQPEASEAADVLAEAEHLAERVDMLVAGATFADMREQLAQHVNLDALKSSLLEMQKSVAAVFRRMVELRGMPNSRQNVRHVVALASDVQRAKAEIEGMIAQANMYLLPPSPHASTSAAIPHVVGRSSVRFQPRMATATPARLLIMDDPAITNEKLAYALSRNSATLVPTMAEIVRRYNKNAQGAAVDVVANGFDRDTLVALFRILYKNHAILPLRQQEAITRALPDALFPSARDPARSALYNLVRAGLGLPAPLDEFREELMRQWWAKLRLDTGIDWAAAWANALK